MRKPIALIFLVAGPMLVSGLLPSESPVLFRSLESETETGGPVHNRVRFEAGWNKDVWKMSQTHSGLGNKAWDELAIVVDKSKRPFQAKFFQLEPGSSGDPEVSKPAPLKARCFACHANGPRAILPNGLATEAPISGFDRVKIFAWNLRIKTYGRVDSRAGAEPPGGAPFKSRLPILSRPLELKSCTGCHSADGIRNPLRLEHVGTANFMAAQGHMPPFPFQARKEDLETLRKLTR